MRRSLWRGALCAATAMSLLATAAYAGDGEAGPRARGPVFDITHFDVLPLTSPLDAEQVAYAALFKYRDTSASDPGLKSFRIVNWLEAPNHSFIIDAWSSLDAFEEHLAQPHSVDFRFAVQDQPPPDGICCIGSPIDDRQYSMVQSFGTPWIGNGWPAVVGSGGALFVITYVDFLQELLAQGDPDRGEESLVKYGADSIKANPRHLLDYTILRQLNRPNRFITLEVWDSQADYTDWQSSTATASLTSAVTQLLGSPLDHRLNILCGKTYVDNTGCVAP
ncbi:MAG TPA: antibiotic biosynthesis monooxygenase [Stellaceae bacterium]|jgi:quinol monooxygenase YgiN|nr:antibiotic biosynthesis monooxygenase [Stellaceae bacterium]